MAEQSLTISDMDGKMGKHQALVISREAELANYVRELEESRRTLPCLEEEAVQLRTEMNTFSCDRETAMIDENDI